VSRHGRPFGSPPAAPPLPPPAAAPVCGVDPALMKEYGRHSIKLSRAHEGSGFRVQKVLEKARRGEKIKVAVLGGSGECFGMVVGSSREGVAGGLGVRQVPPAGVCPLTDELCLTQIFSVSEGHGFKERPNVYGAIAHDQLWHQLVMQELTRQFGPEAVEFLNGAKAATDSAYFEWCYPAHIGTDVDLVMIELAVNDDFSTAAFDSTEALFRSLLALPAQPAILLVDAFALVTGRGKPMQLNGGDAHAHLAVRYDVPHISIRAAALTAMMADPDLAGPWFNHDARHIAAPFHRFLGDMVKAYLQKELCEVDAGGWDRERQRWGADADHPGWPGMQTLGQMPKNAITEPWNSAAKHAVAPPTCRLAGPKNSKAELKPSKPSADWELYSWRVSHSPLDWDTLLFRQSWCSPRLLSRPPQYSKYYIQTTKPNSAPISFAVEVREGSRGEVALGYLRSREYGLGKARCTVAGQSTVVDGFWTSSTNVAQTVVIASKLKPGAYEVECQALPENEQKDGVGFRIMSLMSV